MVVRAAGSRTPIQGALVSVERIAYEQARTDESGTAAIELPEGSGAVSVVAEGYVPYIATSLDPSAPHRVYLEPGASVTGRVVDDRGQGVDGVRVWCVPSDNVSSWPHPTGIAGTDSRGGITSSGPDGQFQIQGLEEDVDYEVFWAKTGWVRYPSGRPYPVRASASQPLTLTMSPQARVRLAFVDRETGASVMARQIMTRPGPGTDIGREPMPWCEREDVRNLHGEAGPGDHFYVRVDASGGAGDLKGRIHVEAAALGYQPLKTEAAFEFGRDTTLELPMTRSTRADFGSLQLDASMGGEPYTGWLVVKLEGEGKRSGAWASAQFAAGKQISALSVPAGRYTLSARPAGIRGHFMAYTDPVELQIHPRTVTEAPVRIPFRALRIDVVDGEERVVVGYDLGVTLDGTNHGLVHNWDLLTRASRDARLRAGGLPVLFCSPGATLNLVVNRYGTGYAAMTIRLNDQPEGPHTTITLVAPAKDWREAWRSD
ncbi:MAG: hypothetical protein QNJ98_18655 [Planctomycetota bacterium]|nr:hypothetical protein [Planctomycetota bacterium]